MIDMLTNLLTSRTTQNVGGASVVVLALLDAMTASIAPPP